MVREKEVREAEIWPCRDGEDDVAGRAEKFWRSVRREVDCLSAVLNAIFCGRGGQFSGAEWRAREGGTRCKLLGRDAPS